MKNKKTGNHRFVMLMATIVSAIMILASSATAAQITQLTDDESWKRGVKITDSGQIIWDHQRKLHLFDGSKTIVLSHPSMSDWGCVGLGDYWTSMPRDNSFYNDNGQVVWSCDDGNDSEIFMYNGTEVIQITDNTVNDFAPLINKSGQVVWHSGPGFAMTSRINLWDGMNTIQLGVGSFLSTQINNRGDVLWSDRWPFGNFFLYDGTSTKELGYGTLFTLNNNGQVAGFFNDGGVKIYDGTSLVKIDDLGYYPLRPFSHSLGIAFNDRGQIAWLTDTPRWIPNKLLFYDGTKTIELFQDVHYFNLKLNNQGHLLWYTKLNDQAFISTFLYDGVGIKKISETQGPHWGHHLNDQGQMAWFTPIPNGYGVNFYDGTTTTQIYTVGPKDSSSYFIDINNKGELAWIGKPENGSHYQVFTTATWNNPPVFDTIPAQEVFEGEILDFTVNATDTEGDNLEYSTSTLPAGASFDAIAGTFTWLPDNSQAGTYAVTFYAADDGNPSLVGELQVDITIIDVPTPAELTDQLVGDLAELNLPQQDMNAYMANLKKVDGLIQDGKTTVAINQLNAFISKVAQDIIHNDAIAPVGQTYIDLANYLILLLENQ